jgi:predicted CoA-binding protein
MAIACSIRLNTQLTPEQRERFQNSDTVRRLLAESKTIAIVGLSTERTKASNMVGSYLQDAGYQIVPVHLKADQILGEKAYRTLRDIPFPIDIVDIFRPPAEMEQIVEDAIAIGAKAVWMQLRLASIPAAERAAAAGLDVVADRCIKIEHARFFGGLHWAGMNTELISARRR